MKTNIFCILSFILLLLSGQALAQPAIPTAPVNTGDVTTTTLNVNSTNQSLAAWQTQNTTNITAAQTTANTAITNAATAQTTANNAIPLAGGYATGTLGAYTTAPFGTYNDATAVSFALGQTNAKAQVNGFPVASQLGLYGNNDATAEFVGTIAPPLTASIASANYTATTLVPSTNLTAPQIAAIQASITKCTQTVCMIINTNHSPMYRGAITAVASDGSSITVSGWYQLGNQAAGQVPSNGVAAYVNPITKTWASNELSYLNSTSYAKLHTDREADLYNNEGTYASGVLMSGESMNCDGTYDCAYGYQALGNWNWGFYATATQGHPFANCPTTSTCNWSVTYNGSMSMGNATQNDMSFAPATTGNAPAITTSGVDTNVGLALVTKGTGLVTIPGSGGLSVSAGPITASGIGTFGSLATTTANILNFSGSSSYAITGTRTDTLWITGGGSSGGMVLYGNNGTGNDGLIRFKNNSTDNTQGASIDAGTGALTTAGVITSTVATGTAPLVVASTTTVANLNAASANAVPASGITGTTLPTAVTQAATPAFYIGTSIGSSDTALTIGQAATANHFSYINLVGDSTYTTYGLRLLRGNTGANSISSLLHQGTGTFTIGSLLAGNLVLETNSAAAITINGSTQAITMGAPVLLSSATSLTAAGTTQGTALALTKDISILTTVASGAGVIVQANIGERQEIFNRGVNSLLIYPPTSAQIETYGINTAVSLPVNGHVVIECVSSALCLQTQ